MEELSATAVQQTLRTKWLGRRYDYLPSVPSTNDLLKAWVNSASGAELPAGAVLLAEFQEHGRGRMSRRWQAPTGTSLLFSVLLRPDWLLEQLAWLPMLAGLSVAEAVESVAGLSVRLKWPNDGVLERAGVWHKFCGILLETGSLLAGQAAYAIIGIGLNVNISPGDLPTTTFPATSLMAVVGQPLSRLDLFAAILERLEYHYEAAERGRSPQPAWNQRLIMLNQRVILSRLGQETDLEGTAERTDEAGRLLIRDADGRLHAVAAGDVSLRLQ